jgi:hypothetical protein
MIREDLSPELFEPYERLITIEILGHCAAVPENNNLLRCFQFLSPATISRSDFCWNRDCGNCRIWYIEDGAERSALACRFLAREEMKITRLDSHIEIEGITKT